MIPEKQKKKTQQQCDSDDVLYNVKIKNSWKEAQE